ncbi:hypothetical protein MMC17_008246 [Xylographa soralifera]|nr:hypothetical protein [Xylographa soralifera]
MERYQITQLNPKILSGLRFEPIDSSSEGRSGDGVEKTVEKKSLLVVPLGNILSLGSRSVKGEKGEENQEKGDNDRDWIDTRFVLFLSIQTDGKPGHLYIVYNRTYAATYGQLNVLGVENPDLNTRFLKFCNKSLSFTVAKVNGEGPLSSQLASSYLVLPTERQHRFKEIQLTPISQSLPEVVESGMNRQSLQWSEGGSPPVGLYLA